MGITVAGLGTGHIDDLSLGAWRAIEQAKVVFLPMPDPLLVAALPAGPEYRLLDGPGERLAGDRSRYDRWCADILLAGEHQEVVYASPGRLAADRPFIERLSAQALERGIPLRLIDSPGFIDRLLEALPASGSSGVQLFPAAVMTGLYYPPLNPAVPALIMEVDSADLADHLRTLLLRQYPPEHELLLLRPDENGQLITSPVPLAAIGRQASYSPLTHFYIPATGPHGSLESLQETMAHLRSPEGCPWDRDQDHLTLRPYLLEEAYEVLEALDAGDVDALREELGDLLLQVVFHTQVAIDQGEFRMPEVIGYINRKLIHRHPHVWGDVSVNDSSDVARNWEAIKQQERRDNGKARQSLLDGVSRALPALAQAYNYQERAARVGFDWEQIEPVIDKIREEIDEIRAAPDPEQRAGEIGDLLFALVNWIRWMGVEPETALREANRRFYRRFHYIEQAAEHTGRALSQMSLAEMDALWDEAKAQGL